MKIGLITDIHEDITRLKEAVEILEKENCSEIICLGDFIGYSVPYYGYLQSRNAHEVIKLLRKKCSVVVVGNHDLFSIKKLPKHKANFVYPDNWYDLAYQERKKLAKGRLFLHPNNLPALITKKDKEYVSQLPEYVVKEYGNLRILFSHYAYPDITGSHAFRPKTPKEVAQHFEFMKKQNCSLSISGHDHIEGLMVFTKKDVRKIPFSQNKKIEENPTWIHGPGVANSGLENGIMILDTNTKEIRATPLHTKIHIFPEWRHK